MVLNSLSISAPVAPEYVPYRFFFLILDVSRYKYPPVWVKASELWQAMVTVDSVSGKTRGFVLVSPR